MKRWFAPRGDPAPGSTDDELPGRAGRPYCVGQPCVLLPGRAGGHRRHAADGSSPVLGGPAAVGPSLPGQRGRPARCGATVYDRAGAVILTGPGGQRAAGEPAAAGRHQVAR